MTDLNHNREVAHLDDIFRTIFNIMKLQAYFLVCNYAPSFFGSTRNSECRFNALKANNYFVFLIFGIILTSYTVNYLVYLVSCYRMSGSPLHQFLLNNYIVTVVIQSVVAVLGAGGWFIGV